MQQRTAAKAAIERAQNELVRFAEREQARPQVNVIRIFRIILLLYLHLYIVNRCNHNKYVFKLNIECKYTKLF